MKENSIYDKKSLRTVVGKNADFNELAKDCVAFSNGCGDSETNRRRDSIKENMETVTSLSERRAYPQAWFQQVVEI